ncbi:MAG: RNA polymerase-binding protein DksA [Candidatus Nitrospinota bacterium M3_3B_026]
MSRKDYSYFKEALLEQRAKIIEEAAKAANGDLNVVREELADAVDRSSMETDRNFTLRLLDRERKLLKKIDEALERLEKGGFGLCEECGEEISRERLKARPVATLCIDCKEEQERREKQLG